MGTKNNPSRFDCYANARGDEPMFILLGRDRLAPSLVTLWMNAKMATAKQDGSLTPELMEQVAEAGQCVDQMRQWLYTNQKVEIKVQTIEMMVSILRSKGYTVTKHPTGASNFASNTEG